MPVQGQPRAYGCGLSVCQTIAGPGVGCTGAGVSVGRAAVEPARLGASDITLPKLASFDLGVVLWMGCVAVLAHFGRFGRHNPSTSLLRLVSRLTWAGLCRRWGTTLGYESHRDPARVVFQVGSWHESRQGTNRIMAGGGLPVTDEHPGLKSHLTNLPRRSQASPGQLIFVDGRRDGGDSAMVTAVAMARTR